MKKLLFILSILIISCQPQTTERIAGECVWQQKAEKTVINDAEIHLLQINNVDIQVFGYFKTSKGDTIIGKYQSNKLIELKDSAGKWHKVISVEVIKKYRGY